MPCTPFRSSDGKVSGFVCTRGRRSLPCTVCGKPHTKLCDGPPSPNIKSSSGTCSAPLCDAHAFHVAPGKDYCPKHHPDDRCPTCRQRNSRVREHEMEDGSVIVWHCNVKGCSNHADHPNSGESKEHH